VVIADESLRPFTFNDGERYIIKKRLQIRRDQASPMKG
jgi:hypothetical protein